MRRFLACLLFLFAYPAAAQTISGCGTTAIAKTDASNRDKLATQADCFAKAKTAAASAEAVRRDRIAALPQVVALDGVASVASGVNVSDFLVKSWGTGDIPGPEAPGVQGAFRFLCAPGRLIADDAILYPNQPGKSHLHQGFGNTAWDAYSTYASLRTSGDSTCSNLLNRSAYWIPAMLDGKGKAVQPDWVSIYYKRAPQGSIYCSPPYAKACLPLPRGLRYVYGYNMQDPSKPDPADQRWFNCDGQGAVAGHYATIRKTNCPTGARLGLAAVSPDCWNGTQIDSPDHRSHMAYAKQDGFGRAVCDAAHPYKLPFFELIAWYYNDGSLPTWSLSSDMGLEPGTTLHADWFGAWEDTIQALWTANCIDKALSCSGGDLGNGMQLKPLAGYDIPLGRPHVELPR